MGEMDDAAQAKDSATDDDQMKNFVNSGRSGRRNAVPEVNVQGIDPDATKLAERLSSMNTVGQDNCSIIDTTGEKDTVS
ncbi:cAMP-dependent protein kinase inhibitor family protein [Acanthocheilonema viteae]